jgi:hypothetical protein
LESAESAGREASVYFLVVRTDLAACREFKAGRTGSAWRGFDGGAVVAASTPKIFFHEKYENV